MPPPTRKANKKASSKVIKFEVKGERYEVRPDEVNGLMDREIRRASEQSFTTHLAAIFNGEMGLDSLASLVYLARRQAGEQGISWNEIAEDTTLADIDTFNVTIDDDLGEVPAAN